METAQYIVGFIIFFGVFYEGAPKIIRQAVKNRKGAR